MAPRRPSGPASKPNSPPVLRSTTISRRPPVPKKNGTLHPKTSHLPSRRRGRTVAKPENLSLWDSERVCDVADTPTATAPSRPSGPASKPNSPPVLRSIILRRPPVPKKIGTLRLKISHFPSYWQGKTVARFNNLNFRDFRRVCDVANTILDRIITDKTKNKRDKNIDPKLLLNNIPIAAVVLVTKCSRIAEWRRLGKVTIIYNFVMEFIIEMAEKKGMDDWQMYYQSILMGIDEGMGKRFALEVFLSRWEARQSELANLVIRWCQN
ncbi:hypothetical protein B0T17DRAFT_403041 [Bombardia bombarda]|uniref:Uncharacterized protein n=1 Tax=Bombardia bombarda TaxID=252184 RepID=A0AA39TZ42_9PEZI|nr:hypothetical protein B0T17DRAFT_403041 [Bombardia bombarda]